MATFCNSSIMGSDALLWPLQEAGIQQCTDMHAGKIPTHIQTIIKNKQPLSTLKPQMNDIVEEEEFFSPPRALSRETGNVLGLVGHTVNPSEAGGSPSDLP